MFKRIYRITVLLFLVCAAILLPSFNQTITASADGVAEFAAELNSGAVFHQKNADKRLPMASTTKIMTALIIAEECDLAQIIKVPQQAVGVEGSSIYLKYDEEISVKDLLYGLMLRSGNDAACALAIHHSGDVSKFVARMNEKAKELGADNTNFKNPSGLPDEEHFTTARDLCNIACHAMKNEVFKEVVSTKSYSGDFRNFVNKNKLLNSFDGANGVKTGYTERAGRCLVSSAKRGNMDVVCVVLNCYDMFERSKKIIDGCFDRYCVENISKDTVFTMEGRACSLEEDCYITVEKNKKLEYRICPLKKNKNPLIVAKLEVYCENNLIFSGNLFTIE